jgi:hypothetical protein
MLPLPTPTPTRRLVSVKRRRATRLAVVLAFLLNVGGGPMAWAHWLGGCDGHVAVSAPPTAAQSADCPEHAARDSAPAPGSMPCCNGGACSSAAPALAIVAASVWTRVALVSPVAPVDTPSLPTRIPDDTLRPPIR